MEAKAMKRKNCLW